MKNSTRNIFKPIHNRRVYSVAANVKVLEYIGHRGKYISKAKEHIKYMIADREHHRNKPTLFDQDNDKVDRKKFFERLEQQKPSPRHAFMHKMVITLSEEERISLQINLKELARDTMLRFEGKTNHKIDWVGAVHDDKGHPHVHIGFRGRDRNGKPIFMGKEQIRELRKIVDQEKVRQAERNLGVEKAHEKIEKLNHKAQQYKEKGRGMDRSNNLGAGMIQGLTNAFQQLIYEADREREQAQRQQSSRHKKQKKKQKDQEMER